MIEVLKHLNIHDQETTPDRFKLQQRGKRIHNRQLVWTRPKDGTWGEYNPILFTSEPRKTGAIFQMTSLMRQTSTN